jgi:protein transport protein SEC13
LKDWEKVFSFSDYVQSITSLSFNNKYNPKNFLSCCVGYSDGTIFVFSFSSDSWLINSVKAHTYGVNTISWLSYPVNNNIVSRFISGGNDNLIKIWNIKPDNKFEEASVLDKIHDNAIKMIDVTSEDSKRSNNTFVSLDIDDQVVMWSVDTSNSITNISESLDFKCEVVQFNGEHKPSGITHLAWSKDGSYLSISTHENSYLYKKFEGEWVIYSSLNSEGNIINYYEEN